MICETEDFLLVLQKWINESATVVLLLSVFREDPATASLGGRISGRVVAVDFSMPGFSFASDGQSPIVIDLDGWQIGFGADFNSAQEPVAEAFTLNMPGVAMGLFVLANKTGLEE